MVAGPDPLSEQFYKHAMVVANGHSEREVGAQHASERRVPASFGGVLRLKNSRSQPCRRTWVARQAPGAIVFRAWDDRETGQKRYKQVILADAIGRSI